MTLAAMTVRWTNPAKRPRLARDEAVLISEYGRGWQDRHLPEPQSCSFAYLSGYTDARRPGGKR
ncbi:hypothetical protein [Paraburkholderia sp. J11-2]|uniref:hypothetical protein n=1 Tax=Paraburkholderia sp. J11-2 TaxID=2805431 RepID=UPI002AB62490|nr:hypothetical protein [Paraburkholderia sp. J11-2]